MKIDEKLLDKLKSSIGENRYEHSLRVRDMAIELAKTHNIDVQKAEIAGLLHDCGRLKDRDELLKRAFDFGIIQNISEDHKIELIHGPLGSKLAKVEYGIEDREVLDAISRHTVGSVNMTPLDKVVYLADQLEASRDFPGVDELRRLAKLDLEKAFLKGVDSTLIFLIQSEKPIELETIKMRNKILEGI